MSNKLNQQLEKKIPVIIMVFYIFSAVLTIYLFNGTGDSGDSIYHYLYAKYAPYKPELYFHHWAKPLFTLLASPFAQFGFTGMKIFNASVSLFTVWFTIKTAQQLNIKNYWLSGIILLFTPLFYVLTYSGLTEPLFALFTILGVYFVSRKQLHVSSIIISFLPFIRSEGLVIIGIFGLFFLFKKDFKSLLLLSAGHIIYSIAGYFIYKDILWVFTKIPYASMSSIYGDGRLFHFVDQLLYSTGIPIYILFWLGTIAGIWYSIKKEISMETFFLVFGGFFAFFIAHSLFWYLGIFNSMGLKRVLVGVMPLLAIISLLGFNFISNITFKKSKKVSKAISNTLVGYLLIFPFISNPSSVKWSKDMTLNKDQVIIQEVNDYLLKENLRQEKIFTYIHPYISEATGISHFDSTARVSLVEPYNLSEQKRLPKLDQTNNEKHSFLDYLFAFFNKEAKQKRQKLTELPLEVTRALNQSDIIIWDNWFFVTEFGIDKDLIDKLNNFSLIKEFKMEEDGRNIHFCVYKRINKF